MSVAAESEQTAERKNTRGCLIVNADDWGRDRANTDRTLDCFRAGAISSVSAMVFMEDSARAAEIAKGAGVDRGLHLNLTQSFTDSRAGATLRGHHERVSRYLRGRRVAQAIYHPGLAGSFEYVVKAQIEEYARLYGDAPERIDGHHHMHLAANVMFQGLLPAGTTVRRNFTFQAGEKGIVNRTYRAALDGILGRRHPLTDAFVCIEPLTSERLSQIAAMARESVVEAETHPVVDDEYRFLSTGQLFQWVDAIAPKFVTRHA